MLVFRTNGDAFDRGLQQGRECRELAVPWFEHVLADEKEKIPENDLRIGVNHLRARLERVYPEGYQECCGIASGLGMPYEDYFAGVFGFQLLSKLTACTAFGFWNAHGEPLFCRTDDLRLNEAPLNTMEITSPSDGYRHVHFHLTGTIWTIAGMNERGLVIGMTGIPGPILDVDGFFSLDALHTILPRCANVAEVESHLQQLNVTYYGFSLMVADASGKLALFEKSQAGLIRLPEQDGGFLLHTNHILDSDFAAANPEQYEPVKSNGQRRFANGMKLAKSLPQTVESLSEFVADRSTDGPICQRGEDGLYSSLRLVFEPSKMRMQVWSGYECDAEYQVVAVDQLLEQD